MDYKKLRPGNKVKNKEGKVETVIFVNASKVGVVDGEYHIDDLFPIPLNIYEVEKLGLKRRFNDATCNLWDFENYAELTKECANRGQGFFSLANFEEKHGFWLDIQSRRTLKFVHEVQNLFHAFTDIELIQYKFYKNGVGITKVPQEFCKCENPLVHDIQCPCGNNE